MCAVSRVCVYWVYRVYLRTCVIYWYVLGCAWCVCIGLCMCRHKSLHRLEGLPPFSGDSFWEGDAHVAVVQGRGLSSPWHPLLPLDKHLLSQNQRETCDTPSPACLAGNTHASPGRITLMGLASSLEASGYRSGDSRALLA